MPLPAALAAKLAKRGLLQQKHRAITGNTTRQTTLPPTSTFPQGYVEEIIAESYDDDARPSVLGSKKISKFIRLGHAACPNKYNLYHTCTTFCVNRWGRGNPSPGNRYNRFRTKMLKKYPVPPGWHEVYDPGCGRHYYWNLSTDAVAWLSPNHPKAVITRPAAELRTRLLEMGEDPATLTLKTSKESDKRKNRDKDRPSRRKHGNADDLDPMDPAAYSDIPRGDWSSGLEKAGVDGKTGVDTTASGPLFQSRPYPNPGAILRANAASTEQKGRKPK